MELVVNSIPLLYSFNPERALFPPGGHDFSDANEGSCRSCLQSSPCATICHPARSRRAHKDVDSATPFHFAQNDVRGVDSATPLRFAQNDRV